jgi:choline-sulfatase
MKKVIFLAILFQWLFIGCSKSDNRNFYRIPGIQDSKGIPNTDLNILKSANGTLYYSLKNVTIPYFGYSTDFTFLCKNKSFSGLYFNLDSKMRDNLKICINTSTGVSYKDFPLKKGMNEILLENNFSEGDKISITSKSGNPFVLSNPIFFKLIPQPKRGLIFLISGDTLAASHMSLYGYKKETTPNITKFAWDAVVFNNAFSNSTWTVSSHMSLFTSLLEYGHKVNVKKNYIKSGDDPFVLQKKLVFPLSPSIPALTEYLSSNYLTFSFNGGGNVSSEFGFYRGFDVYLSNNNDMKDPRASTHLFDKVKNHLETYLFPKVFYFLHTYHTHSPYNPPPEYLSKEEPKPKLSKFDYYADLGGMRGIYKPYPANFVKDVIKLYDAEITVFDSAFGDFITYLKSNSLYDNSTIILLSDHGEEFLEHGSWVHASDLYTEQTWIPLIIKFPFQEHKGKNIRTPVSLVDVMPTLLACNGLPVPANLHGQSLLDLITGKEGEPDFVISTLFRSKTEIYSPGKISIIQDNFKLIYSEPYPQSSHEFFNYTPPTFEPLELYDLSTDRFEKTNILNSHRNDPSVRQMIKKITEIIREMGKSFNDKNPGNSKPISEELVNQLRTLGYL